VVRSKEQGAGSKEQGARSKERGTRPYTGCVRRSSYSPPTTISSTRYAFQMHPLASPPAFRGVNLAGWLVPHRALEHAQQFAGDADLARLANWRFTHVRVPFDGALLDTAEGWQALDWAVTACYRHHLACVLALQVAHTSGPFTLASGEQARTERHALFTTEPAWRQLIQRWEALASRYQGWSGDLLYDLLDQPDPPDDLSADALTTLGAPRLSSAAARRPQPAGATGGRAWNALAVKLTQAIRAIDEEPTIVVEGSLLAGASAFRHLRPTRDSKTIYGFQFFDPLALTLRGQGMYPGLVDSERWDRDRLQATIEPALEFARTYGATLYASAFGASGSAPKQARLTWVRSLLSLFRTHNVGWAYWTYKGDGFGIIGNGNHRTPAQLVNPTGVDYDLLGVLQSEA
jgi:endoglucanase